jgi:hypothetical protein
MERDARRAVPPRLPVIAWRDLAGMAGLLLLQLGPAPLRAGSWIVLVLWSLLPGGAVRALATGTLLSALNPGIFARFDDVLWLRWILLAAAAAGVAWRTLPPVLRRTAAVPAWLRWFALYVAVVGLLALGFSRAPVVSLAKLAAFTLAVVTITFAVRSEPRPLLDFLFSFAALVVLASAPLLLSPAGRLNGLGFQGIWINPQTFGVALAPFLAWLSARLWLEPGGGAPLPYHALAALGWIEVVLSQCRTAVFAALLGTVAALLFGVAARPDLRGRLAAAWMRPLRLGVVALCFAAGLAFSAQVGEVAGKFVFKMRKDTPTSPIESDPDVLSGRLGYMKASWANIRAHPVTGIGFGLPSARPAPRAGRSGFPVPVTAPAEKGVLVTAVLEETGLLGALAFSLFFIPLAWPVLRRGSLPAITLFATAFLLNMGEMLFFASGSLGLLVWIYMMVARAGAEPQADGSGPA